MSFSSLASNLFAMELAHLVKPVGFLLATQKLLSSRIAHMRMRVMGF
jgi:hypothetical protein